MRRWISLLLALPLTACWGKGPSVKETFEETYLPYRVPGDDPKIPAMYVLRDDCGGKLQQLVPDATILPDPHVLRPSQSASKCPLRPTQTRSSI